MYRKLIILIVALLALMLAGSAAAGNASPAASTYTGTLTVIVGDPMPIEGESMTPIPPIFTLHLSDGRELRLRPGAAGENDLLRLAGQQVSVTMPAAEAESALAADDPAAPGVAVASAMLAPGAVMLSPEVSGNTKWLTIACKFADVTDEPRPLDFFQNMYASTYPGLDHYWREASYEAINLVGSTARGWYIMPHPVSYYIIDNRTLKWDELFLDCAELADPYVNFGDYVGVNLMFNAEMGCCAWGGKWPTNLDGVSRQWSVTWLPPWAYTHNVIAHEMTHALGINWHSYAGTNEYGDPWDVVSDARYGCNPNTHPQNFHPVYGCLGQHTSAYHRDYLGWIPAARKTVIGQGETTVTLERATQPGANGFLLAVVPINGSTSHYYSLEARQRVGYDFKLPGDSLVIYEIGGPRQPVQLIDQQAEFGWGGGVWTPGETWVAPYGGIMARIEATTASGVIVTVSSGWPSQSMTLNPIADTYVDKATPQANYGSEPVLRTKYYNCLDYFDPTSTRFPRSSMLRFDATQFPELASRFRLRMYPVETDSYSKLTVSPFPTTYIDTDVPWTESGLNWENTYGSHCWIYMPESYGPTWNGGWLEWDVTTFATSENIGEHSRLSGVVIDNGTMSFSSREGPNPPQLIVEYLVPPNEPTTTTFTPTNDATVNQARPKLVYGAKPTLQVKDAAADINTYIKFNVQDLTGAVQSATLRLFVKDPGPDGGKVYATSPFYKNTTTQWLETGLKWNNAPAIVGTPLDAAGKVVLGQWVELDVTAAVTGNGRVSFALTNDSRNLVTYSSKEGVHPPELVVVTN